MTFEALIDGPQMGGVSSASIRQRFALPAVDRDLWALIDGSQMGVSHKFLENRL
jgi:hypothetical protein